MEPQNKFYEIGYLLTPVLNAEHLPRALAEEIKEPLSAAGAAFTSEGAPRLIPLAYPIRQLVENRRQVWREAHFGWVRFNLPPAAVEPLTARWRQSPALLRFLLISCPPPDKPVTKRRVVKTRLPLPSPADSAERPPLNPAALDKEIEDLLHVFK